MTFSVPHAKVSSSVTLQFPRDNIEAPYLEIMGEQLGTCDDFEDNLPCYNSTSLTPMSIVTDIDETDPQIYSQWICWKATMQTSLY